MTGTALGMGRGTSQVLAEKGYDIACSYYPGTQNVESAIEKTLAMLRNRGVQARYYPADLSKTDAPRQFFEKAESLGGLDLPVNNAGVVTLQVAMDSANAHRNMTDTVEQMFRLMKTEGECSFQMARNKRLSEWSE